MQIAGGIPVMDMDLIQMESRNKLSCHILENSNKMAAAWGPFLESPGNFTGPKSNIQIEI